MTYKIKELLEILEETQTIEFKRLAWDKVVNKTIETIVAMANTDWWIIVFGIDDPEKSKLKWVNRVFWTEENKELFDEIWREIQKIVPPIWNLWKPEYLKTDNWKTIAILEIPKATDNFHSINNHVYQRLNKWNKFLSPNEIVKLSYAKWFSKADNELVNIDFELLNTSYYEAWRNNREIENWNIEQILLSVWLAKKDESWTIKPTRASVLLFAEHPTYLMDTKSAIRIFQYAWTKETIWEAPNLLWTPKTIEWPVIKQIKDAYEYILLLLRTGISMKTGFTNNYKIPERVIKEAITNAVIHRDYYLKRDIEVNIFDDRIEIENAWLFPYNITSTNIWKIRSEKYRNDLLVKHLREFPTPPNLDRNEWVRAMREEMEKQNLFPPIYLTYPKLQDSVRVILWYEEKTKEWKNIKEYLKENKYITNEEARKILWEKFASVISLILRKYTEKWLLVRIPEDINVKKNVKYKLASDME